MQQKPLYLPIQQWEKYKIYSAQIFKKHLKICLFNQ